MARLVHLTRCLALCVPRIGEPRALVAGRGATTKLAPRWLSRDGQYVRRIITGGG
jgi:hypothetical protein